MLAHLNEKHKTLFERIALVCFGVAVLAEVCAYPYSRRTDALSKEANIATDGRIAALNRDAGDANERSKHLEASNMQLGIDLEAEKQKTARFQREAEEARLALAKQIRLQSPRWQLLEEGKSTFEVVLRPFAGQAISVLKCGAQSETVEAYRLEQDLLDFIGKSPGDGSVGAGWNTGYDVWSRCGTGGGTSYGGNRIVVNDAANDEVKRAATSLYDVLNALGIFTVEFHFASDPYGNMERFEGADSPEMRALRDPKSIFLLVGSNPMFNVSGFKNPTRKNR